MSVSPVTNIAFWAFAHLIWLQTTNVSLALSEDTLAMTWHNLGWKRVTVHDVRSERSAKTVADITKSASELNIAVGFKENFWNGSAFGDSPCHFEYVRKSLFKQFYCNLINPL